MNTYTTYHFFRKHIHFVFLVNLKQFHLLCKASAFFFFLVVSHALSHSFLTLIHFLLLLTYTHLLFLFHFTFLSTCIFSLFFYYLRTFISLLCTFISSLNTFLSHIAYVPSFLLKLMRFHFFQSFCASISFETYALSFLSKFMCFHFFQSLCVFISFQSLYTFFFF